MHPTSRSRRSRDRNAGPKLRHRDDMIPRPQAYRTHCSVPLRGGLRATAEAVTRSPKPPSSHVYGRVTRARGAGERRTELQRRWRAGTCHAFPYLGGHRDPLQQQSLYYHANAPPVEPIRHSSPRQPFRPQRAHGTYADQSGAGGLPFTFPPHCPVFYSADRQTRAGAHTRG